MCECQWIFEHIIFALAIPIISYNLIEGTRFKKVSISIFMTITLSLLANKLVAVVSAPYTSSTLGDIFRILKDDGMWETIKYMWVTFCGNIRTVFPQNIFQLDPILKFYYLEYFVIIIMIVVSILIVWKRKEDKFYPYIVSLWFLVGFLVGYCLLYTGVAWTLCRGTNTALLMLIFIFGSIEGLLVINYTYIIIPILFLPTITGYWKSLILERCDYITYENIIEKEIY